MPSVPYLFASAFVVPSFHTDHSKLHKHRCFVNSSIRSARIRNSTRSLRPVLQASPSSTTISLNAGDKLVERMLYDSLVWCSLHGIVIGDSAVKASGLVPGVGIVHAPFSLLPASFPESQFLMAREVAPLFNELVDRISLDGEFLQSALSRTREADPFTSRLLDIHSKMLSMNKKEEIRLGLHRSDYMLDEQTNSLLQIELNTISSSFPGLSSQITTLHRTLIKHYNEELELDYTRVPQNSAMFDFADALAQAWAEFNNPKSVIMIIVQSEERNMYDQHWLSSTLLERIRKTLGEVESQGKLNPDGNLLVEGNAVSVVYYRAGYTPVDYPSEAEWSARLLIEQSSAIKCPCISYHLTGTKKIQQELAKPGILDKFMDNEQEVAKVRKFFAGLWSLDDEDAIKNAIEKPELFVMKPQREGGGNNIYGNDVKEKLVNLKKGEEAAYILMQRIFPKLCESLFVRSGNCWKDLALSELGVYGAYLRNKERVIVNKECGYLLRTKVSSSNEGGVAAGYAVLDSVYLI